MRRHGLTWLVSLVFVASLVLVFDQAQAKAALSTCTAKEVWLYGKYFPKPSGVTYLAGAAANITTRKAALCPTTPSDGHDPETSAWAMLECQSCGGYAQIGYIRTPSLSGAQIFTEFSQSGATFTRHYVALTLNGDNWYYKVTWKDGSGEDNRIHLYKCDTGGSSGCTDYTPTALTWNPSSAGWDGSFSSWAGETHDHASDMPGVTASRAYFGSLFVRNHGNAWYQPNSTVRCTEVLPNSCGGTYTRYHLNSIDADNFEVWTDPT